MACLFPAAPIAVPVTAHVIPSISITYAHTYNCRPIFITWDTQGQIVLHRRAVLDHEKSLDHGAAGIRMPCSSSNPSTGFFRTPLDPSTLQHQQPFLATLTAFHRISDQCVGLEELNPQSCPTVQKGAPPFNSPPRASLVA